MSKLKKPVHLSQIVMNLPPVRCFTCNKVLTQQCYEDYQAFKKLRGELPDAAASLLAQLKIEAAAEGRPDNRPSNSIEVIWERLGVKRMCCKQVIMGWRPSPVMDSYHSYNPGKYVEMRRHSTVPRMYKCV